MKEKAKSEELGEKPKQVEVKIAPPVLKPIISSPLPLSKQSTHLVESTAPKREETPESPEEPNFNYPHFNKLQKTTSEVMLRDHHKNRHFPMIAVSKANDEIGPIKLKKFGRTGLIEVNMSYNHSYVF